MRSRDLIAGLQSGVSRQAVLPSLTGAAVAGLFYFFIFFPYIQIVPLPTDNQPYALAVSFFLFLAVRNKNIPLEILLLLGVFVFSLLVLLIGGLDFNAVRSISNYASLFFIAFATYSLLKIRGGFSISVLSAVVYTWFWVGLIQTVVFSDFLVFLIGRGEGTAGFGGRGVVGLSPEPTHYGTFCVFLLVLTYFHARGRRDLFALLVIQVVFFAKSTLAVMLLCLLIAYVLVVNVFSVRRLLYTLAGLTLLTLTLMLLVRSGAVALESSRMYKVSSLLVESPALLLLVDGSVNDRFFHVFFSTLGAVQNYSIPRGFSAWSDYLDFIIPSYREYALWISRTRIMSGYGSAVFELGIVGLLIPVSFTLALAGFFRGDRKSFLVMALFVNTVMLTGTPLAFPLFPFSIGYLAYYARFGGLGPSRTLIASNAESV